MLFGLIGSKGAGKDETAKYLMQGYNFRQYAFATPLKNICQELFNLSDEQLHGSLKETLDERWNTTPRNMFQKIGTEIFRRHLKNEIPELACDNIWIKKFELWFEEQKNNKCVVSDARFNDEINSIQERNGLIILIQRDTNNSDTHVSEQIHKEFEPDYIIYNNGSINDLHKQIDNLLSNLQ
jgi:dephospho-CoA kinase